MKHHIPYLMEPEAKWYAEDEHIPAPLIGALEVSDDELKALKNGTVTVDALLKQEGTAPNDPTP